MMIRATQNRRTTGAATAAVAVACLSGVMAPAEAQSLGGSTRSLDRQNFAAVQHDYTFLSNPAHVQRFVDAGYLVAVPGNRDFQLKGVSFPYARPEVELFISRLAGQYRAACGEPLIVTSLTRPRSRQPRNASPRSVHPTGMAVDLRRSNSRRCRNWLENVLMHLEGARVLEATRERRPPHYHIALFPKPYAEYVATARGSIDRGQLVYYVRSGDSLWNIARKHGTTVDRLRSANDLRGSRIYAGQALTVPVDR